MGLPASGPALLYRLRHLADYLSITEPTQDLERTQQTFVFPSSCEGKSIWKGRFEDFMISSCKRVDPFASTTLYKLKKEIFLYNLPQYILTQSISASASQVQESHLATLYSDRSSA